MATISSTTPSTSSPDQTERMGIPGESASFANFCSSSHIRNIYTGRFGHTGNGIFIFSLTGLTHFDTLRVSRYLGSRGHSGTAAITIFELDHLTGVHCTNLTY